MSVCGYKMNRWVISRLSDHAFHLISPSSSAERRKALTRIYSVLAKGGILPGFLTLSNKRMMTPAPTMLFVGEWPTWRLVAQAAQAREVEVLDRAAGRAREQ